MDQSERTCNGKVTEETRHDIGGFGTNAEDLCWAARGHWGIENALHWSLDCRIVALAAAHDRGAFTNNSPLTRFPPLSVVL